jgi:O-antigen/teichoic acid export membrane protein
LSEHFEGQPSLTVHPTRFDGDWLEGLDADTSSQGALLRAADGELGDDLIANLATAAPPSIAVSRSHRRSGTGKRRKSPSLGARAARGGVTVMVGQAIRIVIQVASVSILARLLSPSDYGLVAIVLAIVGVGEIFRDFGLSTAVIQAKVVTDDQRDKLFWLNTGIGAGLTVLCVLAAPLVAVVFHQDALTPITRALSFTFLLNGMAAQHEADLNRNLRFAALVTVNIGSQAFGTVIAVALAAAGAGYWALVAQQIAAGILTLVWFVALTRWIPRPPKRGVDVRTFVKFGFGLVGSQMIGYLNNNVDTVTIGIRFNTTQLGYYNRGFQLLMRPLGQLRTPTTSVALPVLARVRDDDARTDAFLVQGQLALGYSLVASVAIAAGAARPVVHVFLGDKWSSVAPVFGLLALAGVFQTISYVGNWVYLSRALTGSLVWYSMVSLAIKIICVLVGSTWGIVGVAAGFAIAPALSWPISIWWLSRLTRLPTRALYGGAGRILLCSGVSAAVTFAVVEALRSSPDIVQLVCGTAAGVLVYGPLALVPRIRQDLLEVLSVTRSAVHGRR